MNSSNTREQLCRWVEKLYKTGLITQTSGAVSVRSGHSMIITPDNPDFTSCGPYDLVEVKLNALTRPGSRPPSPLYKLHAAIYKQRKEFHALINTHPINTTTLSKAGRVVYPLLDDMAQIVGPTARVAQFGFPVNKKVIQSVLKALRWRHAALLSGYGAICGAGNLDDAWAVAQILEKNCKATIESSFLGGGIRINRFEATLMRWIYLLKYSKQKKSL